MTERSNILTSYTNAGLTPEQAIARLKAEHPELCAKPKGQSSAGSFDELILAGIRAGLPNEEAYLEACKRTANPDEIRDYFRRVQAGKSTHFRDME